MLHDGRTEMMADEKAPADMNSSSTALVPLVEPAQWSSPRQQQRPNSIFVTQLIAAAEQGPQSSGLRQAAAFDALAAYRINQQRADGQRIREQQVI